MDKFQEIGKETIKAILKKQETLLTSAEYQNRPRPITNFRTESLIPEEFGTHFPLRKIALDDVVRDAIILLLEISNLHGGAHIKSDCKDYFPENLSTGITYCNVCLLFGDKQIKIDVTTFQRSLVGKRKIIFSWSPERQPLQEII